MQHKEEMTEIGRPLSTTDIGAFHSDPEQSYTLPGAFYFDPTIYAREQSAIFQRTWQYVCHVSKVASAGRYRVQDIGDQSVIVVRVESGELRAFHNVCQHRAHRLLEGEGDIRTSITCPYHAWTYALDGHLTRARGSERVAGFAKNAIRLSPVRVDELCGFIFVNLDPDAAPMSEWYAGLEAEIRALSPHPEQLVHANRRDYLLAANWKNSVENYSECYHCPGRHPTLVDGGLDIGAYRIVTAANHHSHTSKDRGGSQAYAIKGPADASGGYGFGSWFVWPNLAIEVYPGGNLTAFHHVPDGPESTRQVTEWFFPQAVPTPDEQAVIDFVHLVREEDLPICESVQRGLHSLGYRQGRFVVDRDRTDISEHAVHDFQRRVVEALGIQPGA